MFFGTDQGGQTAAVLTSFIAFCQQIELDPWAHPRDALTRIATHPVNAPDQLLPANWKPTPA